MRKFSSKEQHRIVAAIETQLTRLDAGISALKRARANLRRYKAAVLRAACAGRLVLQDTSDEPAGALLRRILDERRAKWEAEQIAKMRAQGRMILDDGWRAKYQEPQEPDTAGLPELPETWVWTSLAIIASTRKHAVSSGPFGSALGTKDYQDDGIPVIRGQNVKQGAFTVDNMVYISQEKAQQLERSTAYPEDLIVVAVGSSGHAALVPGSLPMAILSQNCNKISIDKDVALPQYVVLTMQVDVVKDQLFEKTTDTVRQFLSLTNLRQTIVPLPTLAEQRRIVAEVERRLSVVAEVEAAMAANLKRAARLRQAILKRAFAGRLVPQDPTDEPASALLERIRKEREGRDGKKGVKQMRMEGM